MTKKPFANNKINNYHFKNMLETKIKDVTIVNNNKCLINFLQLII